MPEMLEVVDENDKVIGLEERNVVAKEGLLHRCVYVVLLNPNGEVLLQKRGERKRAYPNSWDIVLAEHNNPGESYEQAAHRGLKEELGIEGVELVKVRGPQIHSYDNGIYKHPEFAELYKGIYDDQIKVDGAEVSEAVFFLPEKIEEILKKEKVTGWFAGEWKWMKENFPELKK